MATIDNVLIAEAINATPLVHQPIYVDGRRVEFMDKLVASNAGHDGQDVVVIALAAVQSPILPSTEWFLVVVLASNVPAKYQRTAKAFGKWLFKQKSGGLAFAIDTTEAHWQVQA
jgi:hypothetical protein